MGEEGLRGEHSLESDDGETGQKPRRGVGSRLRNERERQGLTCEDVAEATKLRRHFVEALEREAWEELPPPVFVKGFITSYARTLHLDSQEILDLYERDAPSSSVPHRFYVEPRKGKRWWISVVLILLVAVCLAYYLWKGYPGPKERAIPKTALRPAVKTEQSKSPPLKLPPLEEKQKVQPGVVQPEPSPPVEPEGTSGESPAQAVEDTEDLSPEVPEVQPELAPERIVLRADILGRTWIRICVDDEEAKEYVFQPGSRPQWEAEKGFYVIVGNAAGVAFEFNGKMLKDLGSAGQVVRLSLPEGFQSTRCEE